MLAHLAMAAVTASGRLEFRRAALEGLRELVPFQFGFVAGPPRRRGELAMQGTRASLLRLLERRERACWTELLALRRGAEQGVLQLSGGASEVPLVRLLRLGQPIAALCIGWVLDESAAWVLGRETDPEFGPAEVERVRLLLPLLTLADARAGDLADSLGTCLTPREEEIFELLQRGYSNRQIALVLGTSPLTVRNQLARLFRKVGVASRAELVGLALGTARAACGAATPQAPGVQLQS